LPENSNPARREQGHFVRIRILQRVFSFPVMLAGVLVVLAVLTVRSRFDDPDLWWLLKTGQVIWTTHSIPLTDLFSYTSNHQAVVPQEWLSEVAIYAAYKFDGFSGLMLWLCGFAAAVLVAGYALCSLYSKNAKVAFVGAMAIWLFATIGFAIRPQLIGYLFLIVELLLIELGRTRSPRWFFWLPVLFAVWVNCHGSFILGIIVAGIVLFCSFFNVQMGSLVSQQWNPDRRRMLAAATVLSLAALFLNPVGIRQVLYPFDTMLHQHINLGNVEEWAPLRLSEARGIGLMVVLLSIFLLVVVRRLELFLDELLLLALGTWLAVGHVRMLFVFGILAAPILSRLLSTSWENYDIETDRIWPNAVLIGMAMLVVFLAFPSRQNLREQVEAHSPVKAVEFIKGNHLSGPMLDDYGYGGYLIWALPEYPVMIDGRADVYEWSGFLGEFGNWATLQSDPSALLKKYGVNFCLLTRQSPMARVLPLLHEWKIVYTDDNSVIFVRTAPAIPAG
jgi:hypothetical protein